MCVGVCYEGVQEISSLFFRTNARHAVARQTDFFNVWVTIPYVNTEISEIHHHVPGEADTLEASWVLL